MTVARFSEDTDAKWTILIVVFVVALAIGGLMQNHPQSESSSGADNMTHAAAGSPATESSRP